MLIYLIFKFFFFSSLNVILSSYFFILFAQKSMLSPHWQSQFFVAILRLKCRHHILIERCFAEVDYTKILEELLLLQVFSSSEKGRNIFQINCHLPTEKKCDLSPTLLLGKQMCDLG